MQFQKGRALSVFQIGKRKEEEVMGLNWRVPATCFPQGKVVSGRTETPLDDETRTRINIPLNFDQQRLV